MKVLYWNPTIIPIGPLEPYQAYNLMKERKELEK